MILNMISTMPIAILLSKLVTTLIAYIAILTNQTGYTTTHTLIITTSIY